MNQFDLIFGFLKKRFHEPEQDQIKDLDFYPESLRLRFLEGENCDQLKAANGAFGKSPNNPIPVNGWVGTMKYFWQLQTAIGKGIYFHRIYTARSRVSEHIDVYETVSADAKTWAILFVDIFHPRRSNLAPEGYKLRTYQKTLDTLPLAFGTNSTLLNFPYDLPEALAQNPPMSNFSEMCSKNIATHDFTRPSYHAEKLSLIQANAEGAPYLPKNHTAAGRRARRHNLKIILKAPE